jgi:hypothetical protein
MATSQFGVANSDLQGIQPDILGYGITDFGTQLQYAENDVLRQIRAEWWERYRHTVRFKDITKEFQAVLKDGVEYDEDGGGSVSNSEKEAIHTLRLVR